MNRPLNPETPHPYAIAEVGRKFLPYVLRLQICLFVVITTKAPAFTDVRVVWAALPCSLAPSPFLARARVVTRSLSHRVFSMRACVSILCARQLAYHQMRLGAGKKAANQSIIVSGESGAGKTESSKIILK